MTRRLLTILLFLLAGAVINVAVGWMLAVTRCGSTFSSSRFTSTAIMRCAHEH